MQDVWSKGWYEDDEVLEERRNAGKEGTDTEDLERRRTEGIEETSEEELVTRKVYGSGGTAAQYGNGLGAKKNDTPQKTQREELGYIDMSKLEEAKEYYGDLIRDKEVEHGIVIQQDGLLVHFVGEESGVFPYDVDLEGAIVIHNHPASNGIESFGESDFYYLREHESIKEMIEVNEQYTYSVSPLKSIKEVSYNELYRQSTKFFDIEDFEIQHAAFLVLEEMGYVRYERKRVK